MADDGYTPTPSEIKQLRDKIRRNWPEAECSQRHSGAPVVSMLVAMIRQAHTDLTNANQDTAALRRAVEELRKQVMATLAKARKARRAVEDSRDTAKWVQRNIESQQDRGGLSVSQVAAGLGLDSEDVVEGLKGEMASALFEFILGLPGATCPLCQQRLLAGVRRQPEDQPPATAE